MTYDPLRALRTLMDRGVHFVVIGGVTGRLWGSPTLTDDTDVCCAADPENLQDLADALLELGARLRGVDDDVQIPVETHTLAAAQPFTFTTDIGALDVLTMPAGTRGYDDLHANAEPFDLGDGLVVSVCTLDDLIRMKHAAGRPRTASSSRCSLRARRARDAAAD